VPDDRVQQWESGDVRPTVAQLRSAAAAYKRPLAVFRIPDVCIALGLPWTNLVGFIGQQGWQF